MCQLRVFVCMRVWDYLRCHFNRTMSAKFVRSQKNQNWIIVNAIKKMFFMTVIETRECISCSSHYITLGYVCVFVYHRSWKCILYATKLFKTFSNVQEHIKHIKMFIMRSHFISSLEIGPRIYHILITTNYPEHLFGIWELMKI